MVETTTRRLEVRTLVDMNVTRCSEMITAGVKDSVRGRCPSLNTCGPSPTTCDVTFYQDPLVPATESIMFLPYLDGVKFFCNQDTHNPDAENIQNRRHNHKSTWDVIKQHSDFIGLAKLTVNRTVHTSFRVVQKADKLGKRLVLAMDMSRSMSCFNRSTFLKLSVGHLIRHSISVGQHVGIVTFAGRGMLFHSLVQVNGSDTRERLATIVATMLLLGGTCIGCGLRDGIRILEESGASASGGTILLVSDGEENYGPYIVDVLPELVRKGVTVHTFALGTEADQKLQDVALQTGGTAYAFGDLQTNTISEMTLSFVLSTTWNLDKALQPVIMMDTTTSFSGTKEFPFTIQEELGNNTSVFISYLEPQNISAELFDGSGKPCVTECPVNATDLSISVNLPTTTAVGLITVYSSRIGLPPCV
ncbi:calcium-activated chloride channel regulator 2-like [Ixodes scapularis]|uniref:calcium-activated chloride channel regulator 2-like n=1 Tax=Ixodes scapularis TaxID=6945 RepID=UPI001C382EDB|nr:calcium-activated chloride channel regulator 2-like [Ixodes scapularis]